MTDYTNKCGSCIHFRPNGKRKIGNCRFKQELSGKISHTPQGEKLVETMRETACGTLRNTMQNTIRHLS